MAAESGPFGASYAFVVWARLEKGASEGDVSAISSLSKTKFMAGAILGNAMQCARSAKFWMSANTRTLVSALVHKFLVPYRGFF